MRKSVFLKNDFGLMSFSYIVLYDLKDREFFYRYPVFSRYSYFRGWLYEAGWPYMKS